jgi:hypothetical protein
MWLAHVSYGWNAEQRESLDDFSLVLAVLSISAYPIYKFYPFELDNRGILDIAIGLVESTL